MREFISKYYPSRIFFRQKPKDSPNYYWELALSTVQKLETPQGILASGRDELYGAIFGRDSLITSLKFLQVYRKTKNPELLRIVRKVLITLIELQGKKVNIESGEEPGKCIHEYRPANHEHLTRDLRNPWYVYPDKVMRNYDSVDATPLLLITIYRYLQVSDDKSFIQSNEKNIKQALNWILKYGDSNKDGFIDYGLHPERKYGGLQNQNWMDSVESTFHEDEDLVVYPIAPVEAQAYTYLAMKLWEKYFEKREQRISNLLLQKAGYLKKLFNEKFVLTDSRGRIFLASAIAGDGKPLESARSSMGHTLWAALTTEYDGESDSILETSLVRKIVDRLFKEDLYEKNVGIRTLSKNSRGFEYVSYHNGSIWPHDNSMIAEGLENFGYFDQARELRKSILSAIWFFKTPVELFAYENSYLPYVSTTGQVACKNQAWSAAAVMRSLDYQKVSGKGNLLEIFTLGLLKKEFSENWLKRASVVSRFEVASFLSIKDWLSFLEKDK